ncbi:hypothetical protein DFP72DRAFT_856878 [Ephemerocybe angulata]|uniref:Uncharacterized protein n=1 Tax=Ephemerocybe angulata TaxID=980116 RepID=A0A8H6LV39_9AGAR|nr:hypothetical protein DFP72DRAFT_856878 [Tulosesus angulatus]
MPKSKGKEPEHSTTPGLTVVWSAVATLYFIQAFMTFQELRGFDEAVSPETSTFRDMFISRYIWGRCRQCFSLASIQERIRDMFGLHKLPRIVTFATDSTRTLFIPGYASKVGEAFRIHLTRPLPKESGEIPRIEVTLPASFTTSTAATERTSHLSKDFWDGNRDLWLVVQTQWELDFAQVIVNIHNDTDQDPPFNIVLSEDSKTINYTRNICEWRSHIEAQFSFIRVRLTLKESSYQAMSMMARVDRSGEVSKDCDVVLELKDTSKKSRKKASSSTTARGASRRVRQRQASSNKTQSSTEEAAIAASAIHTAGASTASPNEKETMEVPRQDIVVPQSSFTDESKHSLAASTNGRNVTECNDLAYISYHPFADPGVTDFQANTASNLKVAPTSHQMAHGTEWGHIDPQHQGQPPAFSNWTVSRRRFGVAPGYRRWGIPQRRSDRHTGTQHSLNHFEVLNALGMTQSLCTVRWGRPEFPTTFDYAHCAAAPGRRKHERTGLWLLVMAVDRGKIQPWTPAAWLGGQTSSGRGGSKAVNRRQKPIKHVELDTAVRTALWNWRTSTLKADFPQAIFGPAAMLSDELVESLATSPAPIDTEEKLKRMVNTWKWCSKYGAPLLEVLKSISTSDDTADSDSDDPDPVVVPANPSTLPATPPPATRTGAEKRKAQDDEDNGDDSGEGQEAMITAPSTSITSPPSTATVERQRRLLEVKKTSRQCGSHFKSRPSQSYNLPHTHPTTMNVTSLRTGMMSCTAIKVSTGYRRARFLLPTQISAHPYHRHLEHRPVQARYNTNRPPQELEKLGSLTGILVKWALIQAIHLQVRFTIPNAAIDATATCSPQPIPSIQYILYPSTSTPVERTRLSNPSSLFLLPVHTTTGILS